MAASTNEKAQLAAAMLQVGTYVNALATALSTALTSITTASSAADLNTALTTYNTLRTNASAMYGGIKLPNLNTWDLDTAITAVIAEASA
jgi:hypothetical protein